MTRPNVAAIIVAAGNGSRSGLGAPKQFAQLGGQSVLAYSYGAFAVHPAVGTILVAVGEGQDHAARAALEPVTSDPHFVTGGAARRDSVRAALEKLAETGGFSRVLIHDAARPFLSAGVIDRLLDALDGNQGAIPVLAVADTLVRGTNGVAAGTIDRNGLFRVQTPQAFSFEAILSAHRSVPADATVTDDAGLLAHIGQAVALVEGDVMLEKLTYPADFERAEAALSTRRQPRTGMGFDVHRLVEGKPLWLCGVEIPHDRGLSGHSDADVAIHTLVDAILGALAEGDIGNHFPPSDPQWRGAPSAKFLDFARDRVGARGGEIVHVDITIICEAPKIGPYREVMREKIAQMLAITEDRVSVKATTTEALGFTGRREGIAAQAVATLLLPAV